MTTDDFIKKARDVHGDKYDYSKVEYINSHTKVCIVCPEHGEFMQTPHNHLMGRGCPKCGGSDKLTTESFIARAREIHSDKYDYSKVEYSNIHTKVCIICPEHGEFKQTPHSHLHGYGCPECGRISVIEKLKLTTEEFITKARQVHGNKYDYSKVKYVGSKINVCIICPIHGEFLQMPESHLRGCGCPICAANQFTSKGEEEVASYVESLVGTENIIRNTRSVIPPNELDMYVPSLALAIEYNGLYWHSEEQGKGRSYHLNKLRLCNEQGIRLIQIFEDEWRDRQEVVKSKLRHLLYEDNEVKHIMARKCHIHELDKHDAADFLNKYHVQGAGQATVALGCFYDGELIAVMTFKQERKGDTKWKLTRFASSYNVVCQGVGGKLFKYFVRNFSPTEIKSFADRRWTLTSEDNVYTKLGFELVKTLDPDYYYLEDGQRKHKFGFRIHILNKKYGLPLTMTEKEMTEELGISRVWNCGLFKYVWKNT